MIQSLKGLPSDASQGKVYDVTGNKMYQPGASYNGKLAMKLLPSHVMHVFKRS